MKKPRAPAARSLGTSTYPLRRDIDAFGGGEDANWPSPPPSSKLDAVRENYFTSTVAPASVNFFLIVSASSLFTPSLIGFGAPSTRSLASFRPRLVTSRTALITLILLAPAPVRTTVNSVFSSR